MAIYKKQTNQFTQYKLCIDTTDTDITYKYYLRKPWANGDDTNVKWSDDPVYSNTVTHDEFKIDHATHQSPQDAHILYGFFDRYRSRTFEHYLDFPIQEGEEKILKLYGKQPVLLDIFRYTKDSKAGVGDVTQLHGGFPIFLVAIPFRDSPIEDWVFISEAEETYFNGVEITESVVVDYKKSLKDISDKFLPSVTLSKNGNEITATLSPPKQNIELYFDATVGSLNAYRVFTDNNGQAKVTVTNDTPGKVKVGFKHFSGKDEILV